MARQPSTPHLVCHRPPQHKTPKSALQRDAVNLSMGCWIDLRSPQARMK
jgi:hypothetical protein